MNIVTPTRELPPDNLVTPESCEVTGKKMVLQYNRSEFDEYISTVLARTEGFKFRGDLELSFSGKMESGESFEGYEQLRVMSPPGEKRCINQY
jgi:hypothetical protein